MPRFKSLANSFYTTPDFPVIFALGLASGLPLALVFSTLQAMLRDYQVNLTTIGFFSIVGSAYTFKFLWSPLLDTVRIPFFTAFLGRRRSWILLMQLALMLSIITIGIIDPNTHMWLLAIMVTLTAIFAASQDIVIDAYRIERLSAIRQGEGAAVVVFAYRIAMVISSAGGLFLADLFSWKTSYMIMGLLFIVPIINTLLMKETKNTFKYPKKFREWLRLSLVVPLQDFWQRKSALYILLFIFFYKMSDAFIAPMLMSFYKDMGFSNTDIAKIIKLYGLAATLIGSFMGGYMVRKYSMYSNLALGATLQIVTNLVFIPLLTLGANQSYLLVAISAENLANGLSAVVLVAYISWLCNRQFSATQYALLSAIAAGTRSFLSIFTGYLVEMIDWQNFFLLSCLLSVPCFVFLKIIKKQQEDTNHANKLQDHQSI